MAKKKNTASDSDFVRMSKDGEEIEVNPLCVDDHKRLGWKTSVDVEAGAQDADAETEE